MTNEEAIKQLEEMLMYWESNSLIDKEMDALHKAIPPCAISRNGFRLKRGNRMQKKKKHTLNGRVCCVGNYQTMDKGFWLTLNAKDMKQYNSMSFIFTVTVAI